MSRHLCSAVSFEEIGIGGNEGNRGTRFGGVKEGGRTVWRIEEESWNEVEQILDRTRLVEQSSRFYTVAEI